MRILIAEDDQRLAEILRSALTAAGFIPDVVGNGETVWFQGDTEPYDAIILDLGLPVLDGLTILKRWRSAGSTLPVLILTARDDWEERVEAIEAGADDYLVKPFRMEEVLARLRAIIRRAAGAATNRRRFADLVLDTRRMLVTRDGTPLNLTPQEYRLVAYLVHHQSEIISQLQLTEHIYGDDFARDPNSIEVLVGRVRKRLGSGVIKTRRGFGYFVEDPEP